MDCWLAFTNYNSDLKVLYRSVAPHRYLLEFTYRGDMTKFGMLLCKSQLSVGKRGASLSLFRQKYTTTWDAASE